MGIRFAAMLYFALIAISVLFWTQLEGLLYPADVFPRFVLIIIGASAAIALVRDVAGAAVPTVVGPRFFFACAVAVSTIVYIWLIGIVGFYVASAAYLLILYPVVNLVKDGREVSWALMGGSLAATVLVVGALYLVFTVLLRINVPMLLDGGPV